MIEKVEEEEKTISEEDLNDLLEETKGESAEPVVEPVKEEAKEPEVEIELEPEKQEVIKPEKESEGVELEIEPEVELKKVIEPEVVSKTEPYQPQGTAQPTQATRPITPQTGLVAPVCSVEESVRIFKEFERAKSKILTSKDIIWFGSDGRPCEEGSGSPHIKRSGWRKLARFFGLSWDIISISGAISMQNGGYMYKTKVKIWHPAGASVVAEGVVTSKDLFFTKGGRKEANEEDVIMKSETVAINRGIDDILGGGEVSAEELE